MADFGVAHIVLEVIGAASEAVHRVVAVVLLDLVAALEAAAALVAVELAANFNQVFLIGTK